MLRSPLKGNVAFFSEGSEVVTDGKCRAALVLMVLVQQRVGLEGPFIGVRRQIVAGLDATERRWRGWVRITWRRSKRETMIAAFARQHAAIVEQRVRRAVERQRVSHDVPMHMPFGCIGGIGGFGVRMKKYGGRAFFGRKVQMVIGVRHAADNEKKRAAKP